MRINGLWKNLKVYRLGDIDLFLSKPMRNDAQDIADAKFVVDQSEWDQNEIRQIISLACVPDIPEIRELFIICTSCFLKQSNEDERTSAAWIGGDCNSEVTAEPDARCRVSGQRCLPLQPCAGVCLSGIIEGGVSRRVLERDQGSVRIREAELKTGSQFHGRRRSDR